MYTYNKKETVEADTDEIGPRELNTHKAYLR